MGAFDDLIPAKGAFDDLIPKAPPAPDVPEWGRENPNLYGLYGAAKETGKSLVPYLRYLDPEDRSAFLAKDTQGQTNELLKEALVAEAMLATGPLLKAGGAVLGAAGERFAPALTRVLTKERAIPGMKPRAAQEPVVEQKAAGAMDDLVPKEEVKPGAFDDLIPTQEAPKPAPAQEIRPAETIKPEGAGEAPRPKEVVGTGDAFVEESGKQYHGTSSELAQLEEYTYNPFNLYGPGFYTTDNLSIAASYTKKGRGKSPTVYDVTWKHERDPNFLDLEKPLPPKALSVFEEQRLYNEYIPENAAGKPAREIYSAMRENMEYDGITAEEAESLMSDIAVELSKAGYDGFSHIGGVGRSGKTRHNVKIYFDPANDLTIKKVLPEGTGKVSPPPEIVKPGAFDDLIPAQEAQKPAPAQEIRPAETIQAPEATVFTGKVFHGGDIAADAPFQGLGLHASEDMAVAKAMSESGNVQSFSINNANLLKIRDFGGRHDNALFTVREMVKDGVLPRAWLNGLEERLVGDQAGWEARNIAELSRVKEYLKGKGYDGLIYENIAEGGEKPSIVMFDRPAKAIRPEDMTKGTPRGEIVEPGATSGVVPSLETLEPQVKGGRIGELPKYAEGSAINLERLNTTDDVKQLLNGITQDIAPKINKRKMTWEETRAQAEELGWDVRDVKAAWDKKGSFTNIEIEATRQLNTNAIVELNEMIRTLPADRSLWTPDHRAKLLDAMDLIRVTSQAASEAGRSLNIHKKILSQDPAFTEASQLNKVLKAIEGKGTKRTDDIIEGLRNIDFKNPKDVNRYIYNVTRTPWQKLTDGAFSLWMEGLLSNPLTHIVNTTSNALTIAYTYPERMLAAGIEAARAGVTGKQRRIFLGETAQDIFSVGKGLQDGFTRFAKAMMEGDRATKFDYPTTSPIPEGVQRFLPTRALSAEDALFKGFIENQELNRMAFRQAKREGLTGDALKKRLVEILSAPSEAMLEKVAARGKYLTYQKELGEIGSMVMRLRDKVPGLKFIIPFVRTPANIAKFALERTPLNFPVVIGKAMKGTFKNEQLSEELAKPLMGTMLAVNTYLMAEAGMITGGMPKNKAERDEKLATGWLPYAVKIGDTYYSFARLEPLGSILGMAADLQQIVKDMNTKEAYNLGAAMLGSISQNISNKTFMQGFSQVFSAMNDPGRYGANFVKNLAGSVIPSVIGGVARSVDPYFRDTKTIPAHMQGRIPVASESLPVKLSVWGDPLERPGTPAARFISPMQVSTAKGSPVERELTRLELDVGYPSRKIGKTELTTEEYWNLVRVAGTPAKQALDRIVQTTWWSGKSDAQKEKEIKRIVEHYRDIARKQLTFQMLREGRVKRTREGKIE